MTAHMIDIKTRQTQSRREKYHVCNIIPRQKPTTVIVKLVLSSVANSVTTVVFNGITLHMEAVRHTQNNN